MTQRVNIGPGGTPDIDNWFIYHPPTPDEVDIYQQIRASGKLVATVIAELCPPSPERSTALAKIREAIMWANASIACDPSKKPDELA